MNAAMPRWCRQKNVKEVPLFHLADLLDHRAEAPGVRVEIGLEYVGREVGRITASD